MHNKTWVSALGWFLSVSGWTLWNILLSAIYSNSQSCAYAVRTGFIEHFGGSAYWWLVVILITWAAIIFELVVASIKKNIWPSDVDVWQFLEKDEAIRQRLGDASYPFVGVVPDKGQDRPNTHDTFDGDEREGKVLLQPRSMMVPLETIKTAVSEDAGIE
jgi:phospholipid-translocating ATPase